MAKEKRIFTALLAILVLVSALIPDLALAVDALHTEADSDHADYTDLPELAEPFKPYLRSILCEAECF